MDLSWQMDMLTLRARRFLKNSGWRLTVTRNENIGFDKTEVLEKGTHTMETFTSIALVSCDGLGGYDWSDQAEKGPNYALMAYSSSSSDSEKKPHPVLQRPIVPRAVLMKSGLVSIRTARQKYFKNSSITARQVNTAHSKTIVNVGRPMSYLSKTAHSTVKRPIHKNTAFKNSNFNQRVNTVKDKNVNTVRPKAVVNAVKGNNVNAIKASACWVWKPKTKVLDHGNPQMDLQDKGVIDSGCSRHMTGNMSYLTDYEEIDGGYVAFGGNPKGGKITGKCTIKTGNLDFENVYFVRELKFNLFSVSQMCDKNNSVLFNDTECIVLSPNFKLIDESQVLLRVPRKNNMYSVDLKNIVPKRGLTCLFAKATSDESKLWHRRLAMREMATTVHEEGTVTKPSAYGKIVITEVDYKKDLQLEDAKGVDCLPNAEIFEQLTLMGYEKLSQKLTFYKAFFFPNGIPYSTILHCLSSKLMHGCMVKNLENVSGKFLMYPRFVQVFLEKQLEGMSNHKRIYVTPSHTKKIFRNMRRVGKGFSGRETPLFPTMMVQAQEEMGEGSANPTDPHHTPTIIQPSTSQPQKKQKPRKPKRKDTEVPQPSGPTDNVADEVVYEEMDDSLERAATTTTSLDVEQDRGNINKTQSKATLNEPSSLGTSSGSGPRRQETMGDTIAQTRFENVSKTSNDSLLAGVKVMRIV
ncbi:hypothetical protein Tco_0359972 [Tanacetum coccineum]